MLDMGFEPQIRRWGRVWRESRGVTGSWVCILDVCLGWASHVQPQLVFVP